MPDSLLDDLKRNFEKTLHPARFAVACSSPTLEQMAVLLSHGAEITSGMETAAAVVDYIGVLGPAGKRLAVAAGSLAEAAKRSSKGIAVVKGVRDITDAMSVLDQWSTGKPVAPEEVAKAFDKLFGGCAVFLKYVPPPADRYAEVCSTIA